MDDNTYSSSAFIHLLEVKYNLTIPEVASMTGDSIERLERVLKGVGCLGFNTYNRLRLNIDGLEQADYDNSYSPD
jgi:hypothetical protein